ncbi:hypothetical protein ACKKBG_A34505 [Auxenochlorella protothecoides x Auxenochlorella symbiontica]
MASPCLTACHRVQASHSTSRHRTMTPHLFAPHSVPAHAPARRCSGRRVAAQGATVEAVTGLDPSLTPLIEAALDDCLTETSLDLPGTHYVGKVRDTYDLGDRLLIVTTDRQSAFDRILASVPFKGQVLNQTSAWWMQATRHIVPNALLSLPDPNAALMTKCEVFPVEFVCRGFMTGSTDTSLWTHYAAGERTYCGNTFPDGLAKNARLAQCVITPTTKAATHDVPITPREIVEQGLMSQADWDTASTAALELFRFGQAEAAKRGLLLVDTKYEFGKDGAGTIRLVDEIHTPDSSRYWLAGSYEARHAAGQEPENVDKEFLRLWFRGACDPYNDPVLPAAPAELVVELSRRYILLYQTITGRRFEVPEGGRPLHERLAANVAAAGL